MKTQENTINQTLGGAPVCCINIPGPWCVATPAPVFSFSFSSCPELFLSDKFFVDSLFYLGLLFPFCYTKRPAAQAWLLHSSHTLLPTMAASLYLGPMFALESSSSFWFRAQMVISLEAISRGKHNCTRHSLWTHVS